jgi:hypothetical protein
MNRYSRLARILDTAWEMYFSSSKRDHALALVNLVKRQVAKQGSVPYGISLRLSRFY